MRTNEENLSNDTSGNTKRWFFGWKKIQPNEGDAVKEFVRSFRQRISSLGPTFASFMYPDFLSDLRGQSKTQKEVTGLSNNMSSLFVISAITGSAILSLPLALKDSGNI